MPKTTTSIRSKTARRAEVVVCLDCKRSLSYTKQNFYSRWHVCKKCQRARVNKLTFERKQARVCISCGSPKQKATRTRCDECLLRYAENRARIYRERSTEICRSCGKRPRYSQVLCKECLDALNKGRRHRITSRLDANKCVTCGRANRKSGAQRRCEECIGVHREQGRIKYSAFRDKVITAYGGMCACCGETERCFLVLDHIKDNGTQERQLLSFYGIYNRSLKIEHRSDYQLLCDNCNMGRYRNKGICPHAESARRLTLCR